MDRLVATPFLFYVGRVYVLGKAPGIVLYLSAPFSPLPGTLCVQGAPVLGDVAPGAVVLFLPDRMYTPSSAGLLSPLSTACAWTAVDRYINFQVPCCWMLQLV